MSSVTVLFFIILAVELSARLAVSEKVNDEPENDVPSLSRIALLSHARKRTFEPMDRAMDQADRTENMLADENNGELSVNRKQPWKRNYAREMTDDSNERGRRYIIPSCQTKCPRGMRPDRIGKCRKVMSY